jgi:hypothetical protein
VTTLFGDSTTFDFSPYHASIDFTFIDGGHDLVTVQSDTENSLKMASRGKPSAIAWHDYGNKEYPELTQYLDELAKERDIFHIQDTMLCMAFNDLDHSIAARLSA